MRQVNVDRSVDKLCGECAVLKELLTEILTNTDFCHCRASRFCFTLTLVRESVGLPSGSVPLMDFGPIEGPRASEDHRDKAGIRGRLPPAGGANRPVPADNRAGTLARYPAGALRQVVFARPVIRSIRFLPCAERRIEEAMTGLRAGYSPKGALGLAPKRFGASAGVPPGDRLKIDSGNAGLRLPARGAWPCRRQLGIRSSLAAPTGW